MVAIVLIVGICIGLPAAINACRRAEERANANNQVALTRIAIRKANQQTLVAPS